MSTDLVRTGLATAGLSGYQKECTNAETLHECNGLRGCEAVTKLLRNYRVGLGHLWKSCGNPRGETLFFFQAYQLEWTSMNFDDLTPLHQDDEGTIRVKGSRVTLDTLVTAFKAGRSAEDIHDSFPSVSVAQVRGIIAWYLNHQGEAEEYLLERYAAAEKLRDELRPRNAALYEKLRRRREQLLKT